VRALVSLVAVLALVGGLPVLLWRASAAVWRPGVDALGQLLSTSDTVPVFLLVLTALGWLGWAAFTLSLAVEVPAQLRGLRAPRLPGLGAGQRAAATLIGGILILLPTSTAFASPAQATTIAAPQTASTPTAAATAKSAVDEAGSSAAAKNAPTYTVRDTRPAESLWSIAADHLGDGSRYTKIADLNEGRPMGDGRTFRANAPIQPGWVLRMPAPPQTPEVPAPRPQGETAQGAVSYTVQAGDTLSAIAESELGGADKYPAIYAANNKTITDPDHIYTGQHLTLPPTTSVPEQPPAADKERDTGQGSEGSGPQQKPDPQPTPPPPAASPSSPAPSSPRPGATHTPTPTPSATSAPDRGTEVPVPPPAKTTSPTSAPSTGSSSTAAPAPAQAADGAGGAASSLDLRTVAGSGALLAGSAVSALALKRLLQRRRRAPGQTIALSDTGPGEQLLGAAAAQASPHLLDHALRALAHRAAAQEREVPVLRAATVGAKSVGVLPDDLSATPVWPFTAGTGGWWSLSADTVLPPDSQEFPPPCPGLVSLGSRPDGSLLLLDLPCARQLLLDGTPDHIEDVSISLALELSQSPWAADAEILVVGFGKDLPYLLPTARIRYVEEPAHAVRDLAERAIEVHQDDGHPVVRPWILIIAGQVSDNDAWTLADALKTARQVPACAILPAGTARPHFPDADVLNADLPSTAFQTLASVDEQVGLQRMDPALIREVLQALAVAGQPAHQATGPWKDVPPEPQPAPSSATAASPRTAVSNAPAAAPGASAQPASEEGDSQDSGAFHALLAAVHDPATVPAPAQSGMPAQNTPVAPASASAAPVSLPHRQDGAPVLRVLGTIEAAGISATGHGPKLAHLTALLHFRPGRDGASIREAMDPLQPWTANTLTSRLTTLRTQLGSAPDGTPYLPRRKTGDPYTLHPHFSCDWHTFLRLAEQGLTGKTVAPLDEALALVRGRPFGHHAPTWASSLQQEMITRIVDTAHSAATHHTAHGLYDQARRAVDIGLEVDESAELLHRDLLRLEAARNNRTGIETAVRRIQQVNQALDISMEPATEHLITHLLTPDTTTSPA
jgi:nucleoid-associated protein YgaU